MSQTTRQPRRFAPRASLALAAAVSGLTHAASAETYSWNSVFGNWDDPTSWTPNGIPGAADDIVNQSGNFLNTGGTVRTVRNVTLHGGSLNVSPKMSVVNTTRVEHDPAATFGTSLVVNTHASGVNFDTNVLELVGGGELEMRNGQARIDRSIRVDGLSVIRGAGVIEFGTTGRDNPALVLNGELRTEVIGGASLLSLRRTSDADSDGVLSLDGARINVEGGTSRLSVQMPLDGAFNGVMRIGGKNSATFLQGFDLAADGRLFLNTSADVPNSSAELLVVGGATFSGSVRAQIGLSQIHAMVTFAPTMTLSIDPGARLRLNSTTTYRGGMYTGDFGTLYQNGDAVVDASTTMAIGTYDWDGEGENRDTTINPGAHFRISSPNLDDDASGSYDGVVTLDAGRLTVDGPASWTLAGSMVMKGANAVSTLNGVQVNLSGRITAQAPALIQTTGLRFRNGAVVDTAGAGATLSVKAIVTSDAGATFTKSGAGTLLLEQFQAHGVGATLAVTGGAVEMNANPAGIAGGGGNLAVTVGSGAHLVLNAPANGLRSLLVNGGGRATLSPGGGKTLVVNALGVAGVFNPIGELDLHNNALVIDYDAAAPSPLANYSAYLQRGYNNGAWDGKVIDSTSAADDPVQRTALGIAQSADVLGLSGGGTASFMGRTVDATAILVRYTLYGDANLDGGVDFDDLARLAQNYNSAGTKYWPQGDFNFDNSVNFDDLAKLAQNYNTSLGLPSAPPGAPAGFSEDLARAFAQVPEPSGIGLVAAAAVGLYARRGRRLPYSGG